MKKYRNQRLRRNILAKSLAFAFGATLAGGAFATAPVASGFIPADNSVKVSPTANLGLGFDRIMVANQGKNIVIKKLADNSVVETIAASNTAKVVLSSSKSATQVTINPTSDLAFNTDYFVQIEAGAFQDDAAPPNTYAGISDATGWNFTTVAGATPIGSSPANGASNVQDSANLSLTFGEPVTRIANTYIRIYKSDATLFETIAVTDTTKVTQSNSTVFINPTANLFQGNYYITIDPGAFVGNVSGASFAGIVDSTTWAFATVSDISPPTVSSFNPGDNATGVLPTGNLVMQFSESVTAVAGKNIVIKKSADNAAVETIDAADTSKVNISLSSSKSPTNSVVTINPANDLAYNTAYYVQIDSGAFQDKANTPNAYAGISDTTSWNFTTAAGAQPTGSNPANGATNVLDSASLSLTFSEPVTPVANRYIRIFRSNATLLESIAATDVTKVTRSNSTVSINPAANLFQGSYYVTIDPGAFVGDLSGASFAGILNSTTWAFSTVSDITAPTATFDNPHDNATGVAPNSNLSMSFSEVVTAVAGKNIVIKKSADNSVVESIAADDTTKVALALSSSKGSSFSTVTINPANNLTYGTDYYVQIDNGAFQDKAGTPNPYAGIGDTTSWNFTTVAPPPVFLNPTSLTFSNQRVGTTSVAQDILLSNSGSTTQTILGISNSNTVFGVTHNCGSSLSAGANCTIHVAFTPNVAGDFSGNVGVTGPNGTLVTASLVGTGYVAPIVSLSATSLSWPTPQFLGSSSYAQGTTLTNSGSAPLTIASISTSGDFAATNNCGSNLGAGANCSISATFNPTATGARTGAISIASDAVGSPHSVSLSGTGQSSVLALSTYALAFGGQTQNTTSPSQTFTLTNNGLQGLTVSGITATSNFGVSNNCGGSLLASGSCDVSVNFTPTTIGSLSGSVAISTSAPGSPYRVALSGTGLPSDVPVCTLTANPASVAPNGTSTLTAVCSKSPTSYSWTGGTCVGQTGTSCTVAPAATTAYSVTGTNAAGSNTASATVTVTTTVPGTDLLPIFMLLLD